MRQETRLLLNFAILPYIKLLRPQQWIKNLFVFAPIFFGGQINNIAALTNTIVCFWCFCLASSSIYILNDYKDISVDQAHPQKKFRPLASGKANSTIALLVAFLLISSTLIYLYSINQTLFIVLLIYTLMNMGYSFGLKNIALLDIFILSSGFVLRVIAGGVSADIEVSQWLFVHTFLLALFIALGKRYDDILLGENSINIVRKSIKGYNITFVRNAMVMMASVLIVTYIIYVFSPEITERFENKYLYVSSIFVLLGVLRYLQLCLVYEKSASPTKLVYSDTFLQLTIAGWIFYYFICIYWF